MHPLFFVDCERITLCQAWSIVGVQPIVRIVIVQTTIGQHGHLHAFDEFIEQPCTFVGIHVTVMPRIKIQVLVVVRV
jgi:hypothetical protein